MASKALRRQVQQDLLNRGTPDLDTGKVLT